MLPIPIFLLLIFSGAILVPTPAILFHLMKTVSLPAPPSHFSTMPALPPTFVPPAEKTLYLPVSGPQVTLDMASVCRGQSIVDSDMAPNSTTPPLQAHEASGYATPSAILPVVVLAMVNCLVYRLLVDDATGNGTRPEESEQFAHLAPVPSEKSTCYHTIYEIPSPRLVIDTNILTTGSSEHDGLSGMVTFPSCLELEHGPRSGVLFEQSSQFSGGLSYEALAGDPEEASHHSILATSSVSDCTSCDDYTQTAHSTDLKGPSSPPITLVSAIKYSELLPPQCDSLDVDVTKTGVDPSRAPLSQEPARKNETQVNSTPPSAIERACNVNNVHEASLSYDPDGDDDGEAFDYMGIDWEPIASGVPTPPPSAEICTIGLPRSSLEPHVKHSRHQSKTEQESTSWPLSTSEAVLQTIIYASDDIQVGVKYSHEAKIACNTRHRIRRASADDLRGMVGLGQATPFQVPDDGPVGSLHNVTEKGIAINQVALLTKDLPIFTPRNSAMCQEVASFTGPPPLVCVGLRTSIPALHNDDLSRAETQEYVGTPDSTHATKQASPLPIESQTRSYSLAADGIQDPIHCAVKPSSRALAYPTTPESSTPQASQFESSIAASTDADALAVQTHKEPSDNPVPPTTQAILGSNAPRGLAASIHAPQGCLPSQAKRDRAVHSAEAPNWAAAVREDSAATSRSSSFAQRDDSELDVPTTSRCAIQYENEVSGVDDSDGLVHHADDRREGAAGTYETDSGLDAVDDSNEQESATRSRRSRRRGKPRRPQKKVPYIPPPRMRNLTQHPVADVLVGARAPWYGC